MRLDRLAFHYLDTDARVAGFVLGEMGNATKAEFAKFLIDRFETDALLKDHGLHLVALMNRLRENRNILEHALPLSWGGEYHGTIYKVDRRGREIPFAAPIDALKSLLQTMQDTLPYSVWIMRCLKWVWVREADGINGGPTTAQAALRVLASLDRPQLPDKIAPLPPPLDQEGE
ncbi:hypothetical protein [Sphingomonas agri]|uniref:hypothetical protein n=1 Tax=Sphingomonas agri TaxID=1813878 RepID=UPI00311E35A1